MPVTSQTRARVEVQLFLHAPVEGAGALGVGRRQRDAQHDVEIARLAGRSRGP